MTNGVLNREFRIDGYVGVRLVGTFVSVPTYVVKVQIIVTCVYPFFYFVVSFWLSEFSVDMLGQRASLKGDLEFFRVVQS